MKNPGLIALFLAGLLLIQGCSDDNKVADGASAPQLTELTGEVDFAGLGPLPSGATISVELKDVSAGAEDAPVIASSQVGARSASPYRFNLQYDPGLIQAGRQYRLYATAQVQGQVIDDSAGSIDPFATETVALSFRPQPRVEAIGRHLVTLSLQDLNWQLIAMGDTVLAAEVAAGRPTILVDGADTRVSGFSGCNEYTGEYVLDGTSLRFERVASTRRACATGMELEAEFLEVLGSVATWRMDGQNMVLGDKERNELARFEYVEG